MRMWTSWFIHIGFAFSVACVPQHSTVARARPIKWFLWIRIKMANTWQRKISTPAALFQFCSADEIKFSIQFCCMWINVHPARVQQRRKKIEWTNNGNWIKREGHGDGKKYSLRSSIMFMYDVTCVCEGGGVVFFLFYMGCVIVHCIVQEWQVQA